MASIIISAHPCIIKTPAKVQGLGSELNRSIFNKQIVKDQNRLINFYTATRALVCSFILRIKCFDLLMVFML